MGRGREVRQMCHFSFLYFKGRANLADSTVWLAVPMVSMAKKFFTVTKATAVESEV